MKIKLFGRELLIGKDISGYAGRSDDYYSVMQQKFGVDYRTRNRLEAYKNVVYACVSLIGEAVGDYQPIIQKKNGDRWETIEHEFLNLLRRPAGKDQNAVSFSQFDLFEATVSYQLLQGDCFWYMALGDRTARPREIVLLRPDRVGTDIDDKGQVTGYFIRQMNGTPIPLDVNEILRFPLFNPKDPYKGQGVVESGSDYIATDESTAAFTKNFFANNAGISGLLNIKGEVTKGAFRKFVRAWRDKYEGVTSAGKVAILRDSDASFTKIGLGLGELDMANLRRMSLDDVMMMFKVPLPLLGKAEQTGLGRANVEALEYIFAKYNIDKKFQRYDAILQFALERYYPQDANLRVTHENIIPEDKEFELNERDKAVDRWLTRDEIRDEEGLDPAPGGDQLFVPAMNMPIDEASAAGTTSNSGGGSAQQGLKVKIIRRLIKKELPTQKKLKKGYTYCECCAGTGEHITGFECYRCDGSGGVDKEEAKQPIPCDGREDSPNVVQNPNGSYEHAPNAKSYTTKSSTEKFRQGLMRNQARYERQYRKTIKPIFNKQRKEALDNLEAHGASLTKGQQKLFDDGYYDKALVEALTPMLTDLATVQGGLALVFAGDTENEFLVTAPIKEAIQNGTKRMAQNFNDQTIEKLNATLAEGVKAGEGIGELKTRVNGVYDELEGYRAERIARTETLKASNNATAWAYKQTGYVTGKQWAVNPDACDQCADFDGKTVPLDDAFLQMGESYTVTGDDGEDTTYTNDYDTVEEPPLHPNCRCTIVPVR